MSDGEALGMTSAYLQEGSWVTFLEDFDGELDKGRGIVEALRAVRDLFPERGVFLRAFLLDPRH